MPRKRGMLGSDAVAATPSMVSQVCCTGVMFREGWKVGVPHACVGAQEKAGAGAGGNVVAPCCLVPVVTAWRACVGTRLSGAACLILCCGSLRSLSAFTCKRATEDSRALMLSRIWSI